MNGSAIQAAFFRGLSSFVDAKTELEIGQKNNIEWMVNFIYKEASASIHAVNYSDSINYNGDDGTTLIKFFDSEDRQSNGPLIISTFILPKLCLALADFFEIDGLKEDVLGALKQ
jgi:hypothetical protein